MKVVEVPEFGGPQVLTIIEKPTPSPTEGMLLIKVKAAGVNYSDGIQIPFAARRALGAIVPQ